VEKTLLSRYRQKISLQKFDLTIQGIDDEWYCAHVNRWIGFAIESNVKELGLHTWPREYYKVPQSVLVAKSITELTVWGCNLVLGQVCNVNDQIVQTLIVGCPVVEEIIFARCDGLKNIHVSGLPKLMVIEVAFNPELESLEIEASNLESLLFKLEFEPCQINLLSCKNLKKLELCHASNVTDKWLHDVLYKHPLIESLKLHKCDMLRRIKISSDYMKSLTFFNCHELVEVNIVTPNLHILDYVGNVISFSSNTSSTLSQVRLQIVNSFNSDCFECSKD
jgi:hypothetical protein